ncbi:MAG: CoA transferase [Dehalococcoidia bacterium]
MFEQALSDIRVLDMSWHIAGPYCTRLLADYGAEVLKVERPGEGDPIRQAGPFPNDEPDPEKSGLFLHLNTNKMGITLNLKDETGKAILKELVKESDLLIESFSPHVMPSLGLDYQTLQQINPKLVMLSISNFGQTGPYRDYKATEIVHQAMGGEMYSQGTETREPLKLGGNVTQYQAGTLASVAALGALFGARSRGEGQHVDISIMETAAGGGDRRAAYILAYLGAGVVTDRWAPPRETVRYMFMPSGVYPCSDGFVNTLSMPTWWPRYVKLLGMPELADDPRFSNVYQSDSGPEFEAIWIGWLMDHTKEEVLEACIENRVATAPVNNAEDVVNYHHLKERGYFTEVDHPRAGEITQTGAPFKMAQTPWQLRRAAPLLGEHNEEVFGGRLKYSADDLKELSRKGVI